MNKVLALASPSGALRPALAGLDARTGRVVPLDPNVLWDAESVGVPVSVAELTQEERAYAVENPYGRWVTIGGRRVYLRGSAPLQERKARALRTHKPATALKYAHGRAAEARVARMLEAEDLGDNEPLDVVGRAADGRKFGVEVKVFVDQRNSKVTVHPDALRRKLGWARRERAALHTVVVDGRRDFEGGRHGAAYSGNELWHRAGVGSFRLAGMTRVRDAAHLRALIRGGREGQYAEYHLPGGHDQETHGNRVSEKGNVGGRQVERKGRLLGRWPKYQLIVDGVDLGQVQRALVSGGDRMAPTVRYDSWRIHGTTFGSREEAEKMLIERGVRFGLLKKKGKDEEEAGFAYDPAQPRTPTGSPEGGQWSAAVPAYAGTYAEVAEKIQREGLSGPTWMTTSLGRAQQRAVQAAAGRLQGAAAVVELAVPLEALRAQGIARVSLGENPRFVMTRAEGVPAAWVRGVHVVPIAKYAAVETGVVRFYVPVVVGTDKRKEERK